nr:hypothetical protein [Granulosicoccus sp.]
NEAILSTYQHRKDTIAQAGEWNPDFAIEILNGRYNGNPSNPGAGYNTGFIPSGWRTNPNAESIYNALVGPNCMVCHALRGSGLNPSISFSDFTDFVDDYSDQVDHLTFERGLMPLGLLNYADFWESGNKNPALLAAAISHPERIRDDNTAIPPGAPVAKIVAPLMARGTDPVDGSVLDIPLSAGGSAFAAAGSYRWSVEPSDPADQADIVVNDATLGTATLRAQSPGDYTVNLTISGSEGGGTSSASQVVLVRDTFDSTPLPASSDIQFYDTDGTGISTLLEANCVSCHSDGAGYPGIPVYYVPCNGEGLAGGVAQGYEFLYRSVLARVNFAAPLDSLILRKPTKGATDLNQRGAAASSRYHAGGLALNSEQEIGRMISWILNGAPRGDLPTSIDAAEAGPSCL